VRKILLPLAAMTSLVFAPAAAAQEKPLTVEVLRTSAGSLHSNAALIMGENDAVLVDPPFTKADAHRVTAMVLDSGKRLTHIFVTHDHPDHFFSMDVLAEAFPDAEIVAHKTVVEDIWRSLPFKVIRWSPMLGANGPAHPSAPAALESDTILLEGHELKVLGPMQSIDMLEALQPEIVVAGHARPSLPNDDSGIAFTYRYLDAWSGLVAASSDAADMRARVRAAFPTTIDVLDDFILVNSTEVAKGEQPIWEE